MNKSEMFDFRPFNVVCAVELAEHVKEAMDKGDKKSQSDKPWSWIKFDRQIAVIAKVHGAKTLYTDDENQAKFARSMGLQVEHSWNLNYTKRIPGLELP